MDYLIGGLALWIIGGAVYFTAHPIARNLNRTSSRYAAFLIHSLVAVVCGAIGLVFIGQYLWQILFAK